jgi:hypothetical protein
MRAGSFEAARCPFSPPSARAARGGEGSGVGVLRRIRLPGNSPSSFSPQATARRGGVTSADKPIQPSFSRRAHHSRPQSVAEIGSAMRKLPVVPICRGVLFLIFRNCLAFDPKSVVSSVCPAPATRGVSRSSRNAGAGCDGRYSAKRRATLQRTAKACGSGAPMQALSLRDDPQATVATKLVTGKITYKS